MGQSLGRVSEGLAVVFGQKAAGLVIIGLDGVGKTTILYQLVLGETVSTAPTICFNYETLQYKNVKFTMWDVGAGSRYFAWRYYAQDNLAVMFVVDSSDRERISEAADNLHRLMSDEELSNHVLLVMANKSDLPGVMSLSEISEKMRLHTIRQKNWHIQSCCATSGEGVIESLEWFASALKNLGETEASRETSCVYFQ